MNDPFQAYCKYLAYRTHFTSPTYDFVKYGGKVSAKASSFETRKDKYFFYKLSKKQDLDDFLIANLLEDPKAWIGSLFDDKAEQRYKDYIKRKQSLTYTFGNDLNKLLTPFLDNVKVNNGQSSFILKMYRQGHISLETLIILDDCCHVVDYWKKHIEDTILWPSIELKIQKLRPFISYDKKKCKELIREKLSDK